MNQRRYNPGYTQSYAEIDGKEEEVRVLYEVQPAEPDVGIMRSYIEIIGVYMTDENPVNLIRNRILNRPNVEFSRDVTSLTESKHDDFHDQIVEELHG